MSPEGGLILSEVQSVLDRFTDCYKIPFEMHLKGYKYDEIAQHMNVNVGTIKSRIFFTRKRMQEMLIDYKYKGV